MSFLERVCKCVGVAKCEDYPPQKPSYVRDVEELKLFIETWKASRA